MLFRTLLLVSALLLGMPTCPAAADDSDRPKWGAGGSWDIYVDPKFGNACYAVRTFLGGTAMLVSVRPDGGLDFVIGHDSWQFAETGKTYRLKFVFGNEKTYEEELEAVALSSAVVLTKPRMSATFLSDFMEKTSLLVYHQGSLIASVLLLDTYEAVTQLRTCDASAPGMIDHSDPSLR